MTDKTTMGITAEPEEVEAVLNNLCGYHLAERDPVYRYTVLTREQVLYEALANAIKRERGRALAELVGNGHKLTEVAELTGLGTRQRVQRLMQLAKAAETAAAELMAKDSLRDFDERLAAVHATLEGVVPAITDETPAPVSALISAPVEALVEALVEAPIEASEERNQLVEVENVPVEVMATSSEEFADVVVADEWLTESDYVGLTEPTQVIPALSGPRHRRAVDDPPWWRRSA